MENNSQNDKMKKSIRRVKASTPYRCVSYPLKIASGILARIMPEEYALIAHHAFYFLSWALLANAYNTSNLTWFRGKNCEADSLSNFELNATKYYSTRDQQQLQLLLTNIKDDSLYMSSDSNSILWTAAELGCVSKGFDWQPSSSWPAYLGTPRIVLFLIGLLLIQFELMMVTQFKASPRDQYVRPDESTAPWNFVLADRHEQKKRNNARRQKTQRQFLLFFLLSIPRVAFAGVVFCSGCESFIVDDNVRLENVWNCENENRIDAGSFPVDKAVYIGFFFVLFNAVSRIFFKISSYYAIRRYKTYVESQEALSEEYYKKFQEEGGVWMTKAQYMERYAELEDLQVLPYSIFLN